MTSTEQAFQGLLSNQMVAFAAHMASQFPDLDQDRIIQMANDHCSGLSLVEAAAAIPKGKRAKTKRAGTPTTRTAPSPEERCMARVWQTGSGCDQCSKSRADGDYCKSHAKKALVTEKACQLDTDCKKIGLFCGRIDQFDQCGGENCPPFKDASGVVRIEWSSDEMKALVSSQLETGEASLCQCGIGGCAWCATRSGAKKSRRKTKSPQTVDTQLADDLEQSNADESSTGLLEALAVEPTNEPAAVVEEPAAVVEEPAAVVEEPAAVVEEPAAVVEEPESILDELDSVYNADTDPEDDGDEMEVDECEHDGVTYYVDLSSGDIYDVESGDVIGRWEGDAASGSPTLN